jgi:hypothetical protein
MQLIRLEVIFQMLITYLLTPWLYSAVEALVSLTTDIHSFPLYRFSLGSRKSFSASSSDVNRSFSLFLYLLAYFNIFLTHPCLICFNYRPLSISATGSESYTIPPFPDHFGVSKSLCWCWLVKYCHVWGVCVTNITGSGFHDWIYWPFFTSTTDYNSSQSMAA